jgi:hypothetical protein
LKSLGFRNKGWGRILGFMIALAAFYVLHPLPMRVPSIGGVIGAFYTLLPYTSPPVALAWFVAFAIVGFFEDVDAKAMELAYGLSVLIFLLNWLPVLNSTLALRLLFLSVMWPLAFILASEWGNLLTLVGLLVFGTVFGSIIGSTVEDIVKKKS